MSLSTVFLNGSAELLHSHTCIGETSTSAERLPLLFTSHKLPLDALPAAFANSLSQWAAFNRRTARYQYYDDREMRAYLNKHCHEIDRLCEAINTLVSGAGRADVFRVLRMYVDCGTWFDSDLRPVELHRACATWPPLDPLTLYSYALENRPRYTFIGAARARHPVLRETLRIIAANALDTPSEERARVLKRARSKAMLVTGPVNLHHAICAGRFVPQRSCGVNKATYWRGEGNGTHFGGKAHTPTEKLYGSADATFRYATCDFAASNTTQFDYQEALRKMGVKYHTRSPARL